MFAFKHALLVRQFEQTRRSERSADGKQGQRRLFHLAVLAVQHLHTTPDIESLFVFVQAGAKVKRKTKTKKMNQILLFLKKKKHQLFHCASLCATNQHTELKHDAFHLYASIEKKIRWQSLPTKKKRMSDKRGTRFQKFFCVVSPPFFFSFFSLFFIMKKKTKIERQKKRRTGFCVCHTHTHTREKEENYVNDG